jgi:hypothetical protein
MSAARVADIMAREGIAAEFRLTGEYGSMRMLWHLSDGRVLTPGEFADLLGVPGIGFCSTSFPVVQP